MIARVAEPRARRAVARASFVAGAVAVLFAAPAMMRVLVGGVAPTEAGLGEAIASAFVGVSGPVFGAAVAGSVFGPDSVLRARADRRVAAGVAPSVAGRDLVAFALGVAAAAGALAAAVVVALLRLALRMRAPGALFFDMGASAWSVAVAAAAWTAIAAAVVARGARPARGFVVAIALDLVTRLLPGGAAWLSPSAHLGNLLGAPPPRGLVVVPVLPQLASVLVLLTIAAVFGVVAMRRYSGPPRP